MSFLQRASNKLWPIAEDDGPAMRGDEDDDEGRMSMDGNGSARTPDSVGLTEEEKEQMRNKFWGG